MNSKEQRLYSLGTILFVSLTYTQTNFATSPLTSQNSQIPLAPPTSIYPSAENMPDTSPKEIATTTSTPASISEHKNWCERHPERCEELRQERKIKEAKWCKAYPKKCAALRNLSTN